jgi:hypothetical protein
MTLLKEERTWTCVDPLQHDAFETSLGVLKPNEGGYIVTHDEELANEIKAREPWALVTEHEPMVGGRAVRGQSMIRVSKTWESAGEVNPMDNPRWVNVGNGRWVYRNKG